VQSADTDNVGFTDYVDCRNTTMNVSRLPRYRAEVEGFFSKRCLRHKVFFAITSSVSPWLSAFTLSLPVEANRYSIPGTGTGTPYYVLCTARSESSHDLACWSIVVAHVDRWEPLIGCTTEINFDWPDGVLRWTQSYCTPLANL
jgi:hypothetical protein